MTPAGKRFGHLVRVANKGLQPATAHQHIRFHVHGLGNLTDPLTQDFGQFFLVSIRRSRQGLRRRAAPALFQQLQNGITIAADHLGMQPQIRKQAPIAAG